MKVRAIMKNTVMPIHLLFNFLIIIIFSVIG
jgi:hypothetical protein